ncbi:MAG: hypothetical protein J6K81_07010 [Rikenellaceae bacterium]|nr:hypothetical protein [Rikenellaceae bacterium]
MLLVVASCATARLEAQTPYRNAIKLTFLSWASGSTKVSYERAFPRWKQSGELCASVIGAGYDKYKNDPLGFTLRYGHKFFVAGYDSQKPLQGFYLRPEAMYSHYDYTHSVTGLRTPARMGALMATVGYQLCVRRFIADAWVGGGYAFGTAAETGYHHGFQLWKWFGRRNDRIAMSFSIRLGVLF